MDTLSTTSNPNSSKNLESFFVYFDVPTLGQNGTYWIGNFFFDIIEKNGVSLSNNEDILALKACLQISQIPHFYT